MSQIKIRSKMTNQSNTSNVLNQQRSDPILVSDCCISATLNDGKRVVAQVAPVEKTIVMDADNNVLVECNSIKDLENTLPGLSVQLYGLVVQTLEIGQAAPSLPEPLGALGGSNTEEVTVSNPLPHGYHSITPSEQFGCSIVTSPADPPPYETETCYSDDVERSVSLTDEVMEFLETADGHMYFGPATPVLGSNSSDEHAYFQQATPVSEAYSSDLDVKVVEEEVVEVGMEPHQRFMSANFRSSVTEEENSLHDDIDYLTQETWLHDNFRDG